MVNPFNFVIKRRSFFSFHSRFLSSHYSVNHWGVVPKTCCKKIPQHREASESLLMPSLIVSSSRRASTNVGGDSGTSISERVSTTSASWRATDSLQSFTGASVMSTVYPLFQKELSEFSLSTFLEVLEAVQIYEGRRRRREDLPGIPVMSNRELDFPLVEEAYRICQFAVATYGWKGRAFFGLTDPESSGNLSMLKDIFVKAMIYGDREALIETTGIKERDLIYMSEKSEIGVPMYFIALNHSHKEIILSIRGTISINDILTDMMARQVKFCGGFAHEGIAFAAKKIFEHTREIMELQARMHPDWHIVVTGHSLGAGAAILYTMYALEQRQEGVLKSPRSVPLFYGIPIRCVTFAPAPVYYREGGTDPVLDRCIVNWINNQDLISRLSIQSIRRLLKICRAVDARYVEKAKMLRSSGGIDKHSPTNENDHTNNESLIVNPSIPLSNTNSSGTSHSNISSGSSSLSLGLNGVAISEKVNALGDAIADFFFHKNYDIVDIGAVIEEVKQQEREESFRMSQSVNEASGDNESSVNSSESDPQDEIVQFEIPGRKFIFRAPVDVAANSSLNNPSTTSDPATIVSQIFDTLKGSLPSISNLSLPFSSTSDTVAVSTSTSSTKTESQGGVTNSSHIPSSIRQTISSISSIFVSPSSDPSSTSQLKQQDGIGEKPPSSMLTPLPATPRSTLSDIPSISFEDFVLSSGSSVDEEYFPVDRRSETDASIQNPPLIELPQSSESSNYSTPEDTPNSNRGSPPVSDTVEMLVEQTAQDVKQPPYVTEIQGAHILDLPLFDKSWRDHVPDQYLFTLKQLCLLNKSRS